MKKLLLSTALVGALFSGAALAETKVGGNIESVYRSGSFDKAADKKGGTAGLGFESNISISSTKALNNGMKLSAGLELENGSDHQAYTTIQSGNVTFGYGLDYGYNGVSYGIPLIGEGFHDVAGNLGVHINDDLFSGSSTTTTMWGGEVHDVAHFNVTVAAAGGNFGFNFAPSPSQGRGMTPGTDSGGSAYEIGYVGTPIPNVSVVVNRQVGQQANEAIASVDDFVVDNLGLTYSMGQFAVGAGQITADNGAASNSDTKQTQYGVTYSTDAFSIGYAIAKSDKDGQTSDEEHQLLTASYNFGGGLGIEFGYDKVENIGYSAGKDGDAFQLRTLVKF
jgi:hypothetical protein